MRKRDPIKKGEQKRKKKKKRRVERFFLISESHRHRKSV